MPHMRHRLAFVTLLGVALIWLLSSPGCKSLGIPEENRGSWDDARPGSDPRDEDDDWVDFSDGGDYADDLDDYYDDGY